MVKLIKQRRFTDDLSKRYVHELPAVDFSALASMDQRIIFEILKTKQNQAPSDSWFLYSHNTHKGDIVPFFAKFSLEVFAEMLEEGTIIIHMKEVWEAVEDFPEFRERL